MIFSSFSKREKYIFYASGIILAAAVFYLFVLQPFIRVWTRMDGDIAAKKVKLHKSIRFLTQYGSVRDEYRKYAEVLKRAARTDEQVLADLMSEADKIAASCGLYVTMLKPNTIQTEDFYQKFVVELEAEAPVSGVVSFLYQVENSPKFLSVDGFTVNAKPGHADSVKSRIFISRALFQD